MALHVALRLGCLASLTPPLLRQPPLQRLQDALLACSEAGKLFIHYLTATAGDNCRDAKRQTISAGARGGALLPALWNRQARCCSDCCCCRIGSAHPSTPAPSPLCCPCCCQRCPSCVLLTAAHPCLTADDVITALSDLDFPELEEPLKAALEGAVPC